MLPILRRSCGLHPPLIVGIVDFTPIGEAAWVRLPNFTFPASATPVPGAWPSVWR